MSIYEDPKKKKNGKMRDNNKEGSRETIKHFRIIRIVLFLLNQVTMILIFQVT